MNRKKMNQMSDHISDRLTEPLGEQIAITLVEALYPTVKQMGITLEQLAQDIKYQEESGIHDLADSFFNRFLGTCDLVKT